MLHLYTLQRRGGMTTVHLLWAAIWQAVSACWLLYTKHCSNKNEAVAAKHELQQCPIPTYKCKILRGSFFNCWADLSISRGVALPGPVLRRKHLLILLPKVGDQFISMLQQAELHVFKGAVRIGPEQVLAPCHHLQRDLQVVLACRLCRL